MSRRETYVCSQQTGYIVPDLIGAIEEENERCNEAVRDLLERNTGALAIK